MACTLAAADARAQVDPETDYRREVIERWESLGSQNDAEVLGVPDDADPGSVKAAYLRLVRRFHPDRAGAETADLRGKLQDILIRVTEAYQTLGGHRSRVATPTPRNPVPAAPTPASTPRTPAPPPPAVVSPRVSVLAQLEEAMGRAQALLEAKQPAAAAEILEHCGHQADSGQGERLHALLGRSYIEMRRWRRSATHLCEVIRLNPQNAEAHLLLGQAYEGAGFATRAETAYRKVLLLRPGHVQALMRLSGIRSPALPKRAPRGIMGRLFGPRNFGG
jgi:tetratricopeptide (TPR) repeat protein